MKLTPGEINYLNIDSLLYTTGTDTTSIALVMQGEVEQINADSSKIILPGQFIDIQGLIDGKHSSTFKAKTDITLKVFEANTIKSFVELLIKDPILQENMVVELSAFVIQQTQSYQALFTLTNSLYQSISTIKKHYLQHCERIGYTAINIPIGKEIEDFNLTDQVFYEEYLQFKEITENPDKAYFYLQQDKGKFFTSQLSTIINCYKEYLKLKSLMQRLTIVLINKEERTLFTVFTELIEYSYTRKIDNTALLRLLDTMCNLTKNMQEKVNAIACIDLHIDEDYIADCLLRATKKEKRKKVLENHPLNQPANTLKNLMNYADFNADKQTKFLTLINSFISLKDKYSIDDRQLFKQINEYYYELYESVFFKTVKDEKQYAVVDLFLNFGFLDERLLSAEQIEELFEIEDIQNEGSCKIYRMKDWLKCIYDGTESPSKNEFDEDYHDQVRQKVRTEKLTKPQEMSLLGDAELRTKFEIQNLFRYNNRLINNNLTAFVPMLFKEDFNLHFEKLIVNAEQIYTALSAITSIDFSVFYREIIYADENAKISKEFIQKENYPVIILFPINGVNGVMWQEVTRKRSDSSGRFLLPGITNADLYEILLKILGRFRWELCKNQQGYSWNNIRVPSLTSEYCDYIQFYRTNKDLSIEKKELLKMQISRHRNNNREIFVSDYIQWIKFESKGAIRLNTVARQILSTYCPFSKEIRDELLKRPLFDTAMFRYYHLKNKKIKELHNRYTAITNKGGTLTPELLTTKRFYNDL